MSLLAAFFALAGCVIGAAVASVLLAPAVLLKGAPYLAVFDPNQLQTLAMIFIRLNAQGATIGFIFFGCYCLSLGYLVSRSTFLPRAIGMGLLIAGLGWLTNSVASLLALPFAGTLSPFLAGAAILGETAFTLWLLVRGVDTQRWMEQASPAADRQP